jgi:uncharacterized membrane protein YhaH (DUF805 family)
VRLQRATVGFLFRTYEGTIDRRTWSSGALVLAAILIPLLVLWLLIAPATQRDLSTPEFFHAETFAAFIYLAIFAFAVILIAVSWTNLSAKRFRGLGRPGALGAAIPFAALVDGAAHWFQPRAPDVLPGWALLIFDLATVLVAAASLYELGSAKPSAPGRGNLPLT